MIRFLNSRPKKCQLYSFCNFWIWLFCKMHYYSVAIDLSFNNTIVRLLFHFHKLHD